MQVPEILHRDRKDDALAVLQRYFATVDGRPTHTGARFEVIGHAWNHPRFANEITSADLLALSTLSVPVPGSAAIAATEPAFASAASSLLAQIPLDATLGDPDAFDAFLTHGTAGWELWRLVSDVDGFGPTSTSKLLARKRANLFPVFDTEIDAAWDLGGHADMWRPMHGAISADRGRLLAYAGKLRAEAGVSAVVAPLRILDAIVWRWQKDRRSDIGAARDVATATAVGPI